MRTWIKIMALVIASPSWAATGTVEKIVDNHVIPGYQTLVAETAELAAAAQADCSPTSPGLRAEYAEAFDAWVAVSHLRFGPSEQGDRAFALAFWPDPRGSTPKALAVLFRDQDPAVDSLEAFQSVSIAARGFYAMEFLLFDPQFVEAEDTAYSCSLIRIMAADIADNAAAILGGWQDGYADLMRNAGSNETYRSKTEATQQFFTALATGLEFTADTRLGRPMGSFDRPRPNRAEARRSGRSLRHVVISLGSLRELASLLSENDASLDAAFANAITRAGKLDDPVFAGVSNPQGRVRVEALQQTISTIRQKVATDLGPRLGIAAGFNSQDGD